MLHSRSVSGKSSYIFLCNIASDLCSRSAGCGTFATNRPTALTLYNVILLESQALRSNVQEQLGQNSHRAAQAPAGSTWVRGWDDGWK